MQWQREEGGQISLREAAGRRRTRTPMPIPHRVSAMLNMMAEAQGNSESEDGDAEGRTARQFRQSSETREGHPANIQTTSIQNQQMGALPGTGVLADGPPNTATMLQRQILSPISVGQPRPPPARPLPDAHPTVAIASSTTSRGNYSRCIRHNLS